jgi:hypothetical protein
MDNLKKRKFQESDKLDDAVQFNDQPESECAVESHCNTLTKETSLNADSITDSISDRMVSNTKYDSKTCLFYSMYNSFRTEKQRMQFSQTAGKAKAKYFIDYIDQLPISKGKNREKCGYNALDMGCYLKYLKKNKLIKGYEWIRRTNDWDFQSFFCSGSSQRPMNMLLFGDSVRENDRNYTKTKAYMEMKSMTLLMSSNEAIEIENEYFKTWSDKLYKGGKYLMGQLSVERSMEPFIGMTMQE